MARFVPLLLLVALRCANAAAAANLAQQLQKLSLDPQECYRVLDFSFAKEDLKIYLTSGYLMFTEPVEGVRLGAIFVADANAGDAEILLLPPTRSERQSLATFTKSPNLEEHFKIAAFLFTDGTAEDLLTRLGSEGRKKSPEAGELIGSQYSSTLRNLSESFETRILYDLLSRDRKSGVFYMGVTGNELGNFDVLYDPLNQDQISMGRLAYHNDRAYFDTWTTFPSRSFRNGAAPPHSRFSLDNFRIEATIDSDLTMKAVTRATLKVAANAGRAIPLGISRNMRITAASVDGQPAEVFDSESLRAMLISSADDRRFLVVSENPLDPSEPHEIELHHEGAVIQRAGAGVYFVASRGTWYPRSGFEMAKYDLVFRYPKNLALVSTGTLVDERMDGNWRIAHRQVDTPIRLAGFNLGDFQSSSIQQDGYRIDVYANRSLE